MMKFFFNFLFNEDNFLYICSVKFENMCKIVFKWRK